METNQHFGTFLGKMGIGVSSFTWWMGATPILSYHARTKVTYAVVNADIF